MSDNPLTAKELAVKLLKGRAAVGTSPSRRGRDARRSREPEVLHPATEVDVERADAPLHAPAVAACGDLPNPTRGLKGLIGLRQMLEDRYKAVAFRTPTGTLCEAATRTPARDRLDIETEGAWVVQGLERRDPADDALVVVDSARIAKQIEADKEKGRDLSRPLFAVF